MTVKKHVGFLWFFVVVLFYSGWVFVLSVCPFICFLRRDRGRKVVELGGEGRSEDLGGVWGRLNCEQNILYKIVVKQSKVLEEEQKRCKLKLIIHLLFLRAKDDGNLNIGGHGRVAKMLISSRDVSMCSVIVGMRGIDRVHCNP